MRRFFLNLFVCLVLCGCSNQSAYEDAQAQAWLGCVNTPKARCAIEEAQRFAMLLPIDGTRAQAFVEIGTAYSEIGDQTASRNALQQALKTALQVSGHKARAAALLRLAEAQAKTGMDNSAKKSVDLPIPLAENIPQPWDQTEIVGWAAKVLALVGEFDEAIALIDPLSEETEITQSYKARAYHDVGPIQAGAGQVEAGLQTIRKATMGLQYYRATALTDVAQHLFREGAVVDAIALLNDAAEVMASIDDGYFIAGGYRHIGEAATVGEKPSLVLAAYRQAIEGAATLPLNEARARSVSRVATAMAESGFTAAAVKALAVAEAIADAEPDPAKRDYARYEITGSYGFSGDLAAAERLMLEVPDRAYGPAQSLHGASQRDLAWAEAKAGDYQAALNGASNISTMREKVMALCRIARVMADPTMKSLPRYL